MSETIPVVISPGLTAGSTIAVVHNGCQVMVTIPEGMKEGDTLQVQVPNTSHNLQEAQAVAIPATTAQVVAVPANEGVQAFAVGVNGQPTRPGDATQGDLRYTEELLRARSWTSCWSLIDIFLIILSLYRIGMWGLFLLIGPLFGYYGARILNARNVAIYLVFKAIQTVVYFVDMLAADSSGQLAWAIILVLCQLYISYQVYIFYKMLTNIDEAALMRAISQIQNVQQGNRLPV